MMNRKEFMERLEVLLAVIPEEERQEALKFYTDYFEDAGEENEAQVIRELGSPENVAAFIKADLKGEDSDSGEFTENGYSDSRFEQRADPVPRPNRYKRAEGGYTYHSTQNGYSSYRGSSYERGPYGSKSYKDETDRDDSYGTDNEYQEQPRTSKALKIVLVILIALAVTSFAWPLLLILVCVVAGIVFAAFGLFAGIAVGAVALMIIGFVIFILGLTKILSALPIALLTSGSGLIIFIIGLIATVAAVKLCIVVFPAIFRMIVEIIRWPFHRKAVS